MKELEPLNVDRVKSAYPDRWNKGTPGRALVKESDEKPGNFAVQRDGSDRWHECTITRYNGLLWGTCDCVGHTNHDDACSHLIAAYRLKQVLEEPFPTHKPQAITVEVRSVDQERADQHEQPTRQEGQA